MPARRGEALRLQPGRTDVVQQRGVARFHARNFGGAHEDFTSVIHADDQNSSAHYMRGVTNARLNQLAAAVADISEAIRLEPEQVRPYFSRSRVYSRRKQHLAIADLDHFLSVVPKPSHEQMNKHRETVQSGEPADANVANAIALLIDAYYFRGTAHSRSRNFNGAEADLQKAIELAPSDWHLYRSRGEVRSFLHKYDEAIADFSRSIELNDDDLFVIVLRAKAYLDIGYFQSARSDIDTVLSRSPSHPVALHHKCRLFYYQGKWEDCIACCRHALNLELSEGNRKAFEKNLKNAEAISQLDDDLIEDLTRKIIADPGDCNALGTRAILLSKAGLRDNAIVDMYRVNCLLRGKDPSALHNLAFLHALEANWERVVQYEDRALEIDSEKAISYCNRGYALVAQGEIDRGMADLDKAVELEPSAVMYYFRGRARAFAGRDPEMEIADFEEAIRLAPNSTYWLGGYAWILATAADERFRRGPRAVELATQLCKLSQWDSGHHLDTLAAAHAENGDFNQAVHWQEKAIEKAGDQATVEMKVRLQLFKSRKPYRKTIAADFS